jgi:hypothetical protein
MHRMGAAMQERAATRIRRATSNGIVALGKSYIDFARAEPGVFALMFGLTGSHADDPALAEEGQGKFEIVCRVVAEHLRAAGSSRGGGAGLCPVVRGPRARLPHP